MILLVPVGISYGWDNRREGFILGGGFGPGLTNYRMEFDETSQREENKELKYSIYMSFIIGYAPSNKLLLYFNDKENVVKAKSENGDEVFTFDDLLSFGASYYLKESSPSLFFSGGIGFSAWEAKDCKDQKGFGAFTGIGYEFSRHWSVDLSLKYNNLTSDTGNPKLKTQTFSVSASVNLLGF